MTTKANGYFALPRRSWNLGASHQMSRLIDLVIACVLLAITLPLMVLVALAIRCDNRGPVLQRHSGIGYDGHRFPILSFRTIVYEPERSTAEWVSERTTRVGNFLRYTRIDTLPQLINVLRGEMSLIDSDARSPSFLD